MIHLIEGRFSGSGHSYTIEEFLLKSGELDMDKAIVVAEGNLGLWERGQVGDRQVVGDAASLGTVRNREGWLCNVLKGEHCSLTSS